MHPNLPIIHLRDDVRHRHRMVFRSSSFPNFERTAIRLLLAINSHDLCAFLIKHRGADIVIERLSIVAILFMGFATYPTEFHAQVPGGLGQVLAEFLRDAISSRNGELFQAPDRGTWRQSNGSSPRERT